MEKSQKKYKFIIGTLVLITIIVITIILINTNLFKIKKYLKNEGYECSNIECAKTINNYQMVINTSNLYLTATSDTYVIKVTNKEIFLQNRSDKSTCLYTKDNYKINELINNDFEYTVYCQEYISEINTVLEEYKDILNLSKVKISKEK